MSGIPLARTALIVAFACVLPACGGEAEESKLRLPPPWDRSAPKIETAEEGASVVRHQQEDHCRRELVGARCEDAGTVWRCAYRTATGGGTTSIEKDFGHEGERVTCGP